MIYGFGWEPSATPSPLSQHCAVKGPSWPWRTVRQRTLKGLSLGIRKISGERMEKPWKFWVIQKNQLFLWFFFVLFCNISRIQLLESNCLKNQQPEDSPHPETELPGGAIPNSIDPIENARVHMRGSTDLVLSTQPLSPRFFRPAVESGKDLTMSKTPQKNRWEEKLRVFLKVGVPRNPGIPWWH